MHPCLLPERDEVGHDVEADLDPARVLEKAEHPLIEGLSRRGGWDIHGV